MATQQYEDEVRVSTRRYEDSPTTAVHYDEFDQFVGTVKDLMDELRRMRAELNEREVVAGKREAQRREILAGLNNEIRTLLSPVAKDNGYR